MPLQSLFIEPELGFYVIIPPEYQSLGCLPADYFFPYLMEYHQTPYYAALLTAARYYGAAHQSSPIFQVMSPKHLLDIQCGKLSVQFIINKNLNENPVPKIETARSMLVVSTAETTVMDLLKYPAQSGGLNHIVTVTNELLEIISSEKL
jgi:predicted transcriptional regulator of viral defense system